MNQDNDASTTKWNIVFDCRLVCVKTTNFKKHCSVSECLVDDDRKLFECFSAQVFERLLLNVADCMTIDLPFISCNVISLMKVIAETICRVAPTRTCICRG